MPMFGFDEQYAYYGMTPVDNRFILEYLPNAAGDAVRVYLYGLVQCHHPDQSMTIEKMGRELGLTEEEILKAYRYWERKGLVRRVADHPPTFQYVNGQKAFNGDPGMVDQDYEAFTAQVQRLFSDRRMHGGELLRCYEWVEEMGLPQEVVLYLMEHMIRLHGKKVAILTIEKRAELLADEQVKTLEDARVILDFDRRVLQGCRDVVSRMGKRRNPTDAELRMYRSWLADWKYTEEDISAACDQMVSGDPSFKYLNGILKRMNEKRDGSHPQKVADIVQQEKDEAEPLKKLLAEMNVRNVSVNSSTIAEYVQMRTLYPDEIIRLAGKECAKRKKSFDDVMKTLKNWKRNGLESVADIEKYMKQVDDMNDFLLMLYEELGVSAQPNAADRRLAQKWMKTFGYDMGFITQCAPWASGKEKPMAYLDALLTRFHDRGIDTMAAARREREQHQQLLARQPAQGRAPKTVEQQRYTQRTYEDNDDVLDAMMKKWQEENANA